MLSGNAWSPDVSLLSRGAGDARESWQTFESRQTNSRLALETPKHREASDPQSPRFYQAKSVRVKRCCRCIYKNGICPTFQLAELLHTYCCLSISLQAERQVIFIILFSQRRKAKARLFGQLVHSQRGRSSFRWVSAPRRCCPESTQQEQHPAWCVASESVLRGGKFQDWNRTPFTSFF